MRCKVTQKLLITSIFVHQNLDKNQFFIYFTIQSAFLAKKFVPLSPVKCDLKQLI